VRFEHPRHTYGSFGLPLLESGYDNSEACRKKPSILHHTQELRKSGMGEDQQKAFEDLNLYLEHLPTLSTPEQGQPLIMYVSATHSAVSGALVIEKEIIKEGKNVNQ
jgi:hypothetical protein